jgi:hypothetical protein
MLIRPFQKNILKNLEDVLGTWIFLADFEFWNCLSHA